MRASYTQYSTTWNVEHLFYFSKVDVRHNKHDRFQNVRLIRKITNAVT